MKKLNKISTLFVPVIYILVTVFFLRGIIFDKGVIVGGDWGYPITPTQMNKYAQSGFFTWTDRELLGDSQPFLNTLPFQVIIALLAKLEIGGSIYLRILLVFTYVFSATSMFYLCRFFKLRKGASLIGGLLLITTPIYFNYTAMGWLYTLLSLGIMPLVVILFTKSVRSSQILYAINTGILVFLASTQSQAIVWFPILFFSLSLFLIRDKTSLKRYSLSIILAFLTFTGLSFYWILPFLVKNNLSVSTGLNLSSASLGTWIKFNPINTIRLWGSLFNSQFEESYPPSLTFISYLTPVLLIASLFFVKRKKLILSMLSLFSFPLFVYLIGPELISKLPFSDLIRDAARFLTLSSFAYAFVLALLSDTIFKSPRKVNRFLSSIIILVLFLNTLPFWTGSLSGKQAKETDIRLRTYEFPSSYHTVENILASSQSTGKTLYLPTDIFLRPMDVDEFSGAYQGFPDIFASYSPIQGKAGYSDKSNKISASYISWLEYLLENSNMDSFDRALDFLGIRHLVIRKDVAYSGNLSGNDIDSLLMGNNDFKLIIQNKEISFYENIDTLPIVYIPLNITFHENKVSEYEKYFKIFNDSQASNSYISNADPEIRRNINSSIGCNYLLISYPNNSLEEKHFNIKEKTRENFTLPYVRHKPKSFFWKIAKFKNNYLDKYKWDDSPRGKINRNLFYLSKNISELEIFGDTSETSNFLIEEFKRGSRSIESELEDCRNGEEKQDLALEVSETFTMFYQKVKEISETILRKKENNTSLNESYSRWLKEIEETKKRINNYEPKPDIANLSYQLRVPEEGVYELRLNTSDYKEFIIDGDITTLRPSSKSNQSSGQVYFKAGEHNIIIQLSYPQNLFTGIWEKAETTKVKDGVANFLSLTPFGYSSDGLVQQVNNWSDGAYHFSFDYKTTGTGLRVGIIERSSNIFPQNQLIFDTTLSPRRENWEKYGAIVKGSQFSNWASAVFFSVDNKNTGGLTEVKNVQMQRVTKPVIMAEKQSGVEVEKILYPRIDVSKINPTKYIARIYGVNESFVINLSESFNPNWKAKIIKNNHIHHNTDNLDYSEKLINANKADSLLAKLGLVKHRQVPEKYHFIVNDFGNGWYIDKTLFGDSNIVTIIFDYDPQKYFYLGAFISLIVSLLIILANLISLFTRKN